MYLSTLSIFVVAVISPLLPALCLLSPAIYSELSYRFLLAKLRSAVAFDSGSVHFEFFGLLSGVIVESEILQPPQPPFVIST